MVLNDIINEAATGPTFSGIDPSSPPTVSAIVGGRSTQIRPSIASLTKGDPRNHRRTASRRKISTMYDEEEGPRLKELINDAFYRGIDVFCIWDCCGAYIKLSEVCNLFSLDTITTLSLLLSHAHLHIILVALLTLFLFSSTWLSSSSTHLWTYLSPFA